MTNDSGFAALAAQIVQDAGDAIIYADRDGVVRLWNRGAERMFGFTAAEAIGQSMDLIIPERLRARHWDGWNRVMETGVTRYGSEVLAVPALRKDGQTISVEFTIQLVRDADGRILGPAAVMRDVTARFKRDLSDLLRMARKGCRVDLQVLVGACGNPQDYADGWEKIVIFRDGSLTNISGENMGALSDDENNPSNEMSDVSARDWYELKKLTFAHLASALTVRELISVSICDALSCGDCGEASNGDEKIFVTMIGTGSTPGTLPSVLYSSDGGATWGTTDIDTLFSNETMGEGTCVGRNFVVLGVTSHSLHYAPSADILTGTEVWTEVLTGFAAGGDPVAIWSLDPRTTWIVGNGGYIYFTADPTAGVSIQDAGVSTTENLLDVHAYDTEHAIAGGENNVLVYTVNGGDTWQLLAGPEAGASLTAVWMWSQNTWMVGTSTGALWATNDSGTTWAEVPLPASVTRIDAIKFVDDTVGYMAVRTGANGEIMRTTCGGSLWNFLPENGVAIPANDYIKSLAVSPYNHNLVFGAGLADNATAGMRVKAA